MLGLSRSQLAVYGAVAIALLLVGARFIRSSSPGEQGAPQSSRPFRILRGARENVVHVAGAVRSPGIYKLDAGARVADAVQRAGGSRRGANLDAINLAARVADGQQIVVPRRQGASGTASGLEEGAAAGPVSLGSASPEQLETLDGVGPATARKIIGYRAQHGGFGSVEELDKVSGIGPKKLEAIRDQVQP